MAIENYERSWGTREYLAGRWTDRVAYSDHGGGYAFRPNQVVVPTASADDAFAALTARVGHEIGGDVVIDRNSHFVDLGLGCTLIDHPDLLTELLLWVLELLGIQRDPNYVVFCDTDTTGPHTDGVGANPVFGNPVFGNPVFGNPVFGNPVFGNPVFGNPVFGNPVFGNPVFGNGAFVSPTWANPNWSPPLYMSPLYSDRYHDPTRRATGRIPTAARPALGKNEADNRPPMAGVGRIKVVVLDTGLAPDGGNPDMRPKFLDGLQAAVDDIDLPDTDTDKALDPVAGHGTFIAGIVRQLVPGVDVVSKRVLSSFGDGDVGFVHQTVQGLGIDEHTIVNMSFSGYADHEMGCLGHVVRAVRDQGGVVVASAGNDGLGRPSYPASLTGVVGVGGLGLAGPAPFTNWGPWIRACAPAVDLTSCFYVRPQNGQGDDLKSPQPAWTGMPDALDTYDGWARWKGTSFAAPIVAAAIAREMVRRPTIDAQEAERAVIDGPDLMRIPYLGAVINMSPPRPSA